MNKHTPGPWRLGKNSDDVVADQPAGHSEESDHVAYYGGHLVAESICGGNRPLIAAAPELLEALEELLEDAHEAMRRANDDGAFYDLDGDLAKARAAIAKARDEP